MERVWQTTAVKLGTLLDAREGTVVTLVAGDTRLLAHRAVLTARSPVFAAMFRHDTLEAGSGQVTITDVEGPVLCQLLEYMYTLQVPQLSGTAYQLLAAADKYGVSGLKDECERQVTAQLAVGTAAASAVLAVRHSCTSLKQAAVSYIKAHLVPVMATQGWADMMRSQPEHLIEVSRLLSDPPAKTRVPATGGSKPTCADQGPTPAAVLSRMRSLPQKEKNEKLMKAAGEGAVRKVQTLLAAGANVPRGSWTALHSAALYGHVDVVRLLLENGAEVDTGIDGRDMPIHMAAKRGHKAVVQLLLAYSADINARGEEGKTALHWAAFEGHADVATTLLEAGADTGARDEWGQTPLDIAREENRQQVIEILS